MEKQPYIVIKDLQVYQLSRQLSQMAWMLYSRMNYEDKKILGDQFIRATDSIGANIAEGYSRFHYLDKVRFYYNARASQSEATDHWLELLFERQKIDSSIYADFKTVSKELQIKLNNFIKYTKNEKQNST